MAEQHGLQLRVIDADDMALTSDLRSEPDDHRHPLRPGHQGDRGLTPADAC